MISHASNCKFKTYKEATPQLKPNVAVVLTSPSD